MYLKSRQASIELSSHQVAINISHNIMITQDKEEEASGNEPSMDFLTVQEDVVSCDGGFMLNKDTLSDKLTASSMSPETMLNYIGDYVHINLQQPEANSTTGESTTYEDESDTRIDAQSIIKAIEKGPLDAKLK